MKIGELLIMNGLITQEQLEHALHQQLHSSQKLGEILMEQGVVTEIQLAEALEFQLGIPVVKLNEATVEQEMIQLVDEEMAIRLNVMPVERRAGKLRLAMADPLNKEGIQEIQAATGMTVQPLIALRSELERVRKLHYGEAERHQQFTEIITLCLQNKSNGIYFDPQENGLLVKYRIENVLKTQRTVPTDKQKAFVNFIKRSAGMITNERRLPQDGRFTKTLDNEMYNIRVSTLPITRGEQLFIKITKRNESIVTLSEIGFTDSHLQHVEAAVQRSKGLVLVADENGSSRTATLYSLVKHVMKDDIHIATIEDPVEHIVEGVSQVEVNDGLGLTFAHGLRAILRQNPNVVMVGETKDVDTAEAAVKASLTDCLVIAGVQGTSAVKTIKQLQNLGIDSPLLALSLTCVIHQRTVRRVCAQCAQNTPMTADETEVYGKHELLQPENQNTVLGNFRTFVSAHFHGKPTVIRGSGCRLCNHTGYRGQVGIYEVLSIDDTLRSLIAQNRSIDEYETYLKQIGHKTLLHDGLIKARNGITTLEEVLT
ncbi:GspE/PulE family protein [Paenibacillus thermotolerans]|uniref:GspE/PulE family protein n=1 Tax=Paenibacillus thermotolerans TaxID=3027807 RepID=UPI002368A3B5|nr:MULTISPECIES: GspE/PulE family protein [unclassified Paenibacillus]